MTALILEEAILFGRNDGIDDPRWAWHAAAALGAHALYPPSTCASARNIGRVRR
jgi:hypothetical protein